MVLRLTRSMTEAVGLGRKEIQLGVSKGGGIPLVFDAYSFAVTTILN